MRIKLFNRPYVKGEIDVSSIIMGVVAVIGAIFNLPIA